jgi:hypothetical protein
MASIWVDFGHDLHGQMRILRHTIRGSLWYSSPAMMIFSNLLLSIHGTFNLKRIYIPWHKSSRQIDTLLVTAILNPLLSGHHISLHDS